jgi:hypothetical protein
MGTLHEALYIFMIISGLSLLRIRKLSGKFCIEYQNTHFIYNNFSPYLVVYEIMWKYVLECTGPHKIQCGVCALLAGYLWLQTRIQNI